MLANTVSKLKAVKLNTVIFVFLPLRKIVVWQAIHHKFCFCSLAVLKPKLGRTFPVLCQSDWLFHGESCPRLDVIHPGRAWPSSPACTWHCSLHYLFLQATPLFPHGVTTYVTCMTMYVVVFYHKLSAIRTDCWQRGEAGQWFAGNGCAGLHLFSTLGWHQSGQ